MRYLHKLIISTLFIATFGYGTTINVPADQTTIQAGIDAASDGDTVLVAADTYVENIDFNGKNIVVGSLYLTTSDTSYISSTIIDGNQDGSVVTFSDGENTTAELSGFTITNGNSENGGGIYCVTASPELTGLIISDNTADTHGGGVYIYDYADPTFTNVTISGNVADVEGGGIWTNRNSSPSFTNVTMSNNEASVAGGIMIRDNSDPTLTNVTISNNVADNTGGGIMILLSSSPEFSNLTVSNNEASYGAGVFIESNNSDPIFTDVTISGNAADNNGGGIYLYMDCEPVFTNLKLLNNTADYGGGIYTQRDIVGIVFNNVTAYGNLASERGGFLNVSYTGWADNGDQLEFSNAIIWNNFPEEIYVDQNEDMLYNTLTFSYTNLRRGENGIVGNNTTDIFWQDGNISQDPLFCDYENNDFTLGQDSPCYQTGEDGINMGAEEEYGCETGQLSPHSGPVWHVATTGSEQDGDGSLTSPYATIQKAINSSYEGTGVNNRDTIIVQPGLYYETLTTIGKKLLLTSTEGRDSTIIDANGDGRGFTFNQGETAATEISGFTIRNGSTDYGGGIYINGCSPTLSDLIITANTASGGGGAYYSNSESEVSNVIIDGNEASEGGGVNLGGGSVSFTNVEVKNNHASYRGGGMQFYGCDNMELDQITISNNTAANAGGGFSCLSGCDPHFTNFTISNNISNGHGGGAWFHHSGTWPTFSDGIFSENTAVNDGGGINGGGGPIVTLERVIFQNNEAQSGGGIYTDTEANLDSVQFIGNEASGSGGGITFIGGDLNVEKTVFNDNVSASGSAIYLESNVDAEFGNIVIANHNDESSSTFYINNNVDVTIEHLSTWNNGDPDNSAFLYVGNSSSQNEITFVNSILWNSSPQEIQFQEGNSNHEISLINTNIKGGLDDIINPSSVTIDTVGALLNIEPRYVDPENGNFALEDYSLMIGAGTLTYSIGDDEYQVAGQDILATDRPMPAMTDPDLGAYENELGIPTSSLPIVEPIANFESSENKPIRVTVSVQDYDSQPSEIIGAVSSSNSDLFSAENMSAGSFENKSLIFDGSDDSVFVDDFFYDSDTIVVEFWVKADTFPIGDRFWLFAYGDGYFESGAMVITLEKGDNLLHPRIWLGNGDWANWYSAGNIELDQWNHLAVKKVGSSIKLYFNGNQIVSMSNDSHTLQESPNIYLGTTPTDAEMFNGSMDEIRVWSEDRNLSTVQAHMNKQYIPTENDDLVLLYRFSMQDTSKIIDASGNGYDGVIQDPAFSDDTPSLDNMLSTLSLEPSENTFGEAEITLSISDNTSTASEIFTVTVYHLPQITNLIVGESGSAMMNVINHNPVISFEYFDSMDQPQTGFQIQVSSFPSFADLDIWDTGVISDAEDSIVFNGNELMDGETYYLRGKVFSGDTSSVWENIIFRMNSLPSVPAPIYPLENELVEMPYTFLMSPSSDSENDLLTYDFFLSTDSTFDSIVYNIDNLVQENSTVTWDLTDELIENSLYWWKGRSTDQFEYSSYNEPQYFWINNVNEAPGSFELIQPDDSVDVTDLTPFLDWTSSADDDPLDTVNYDLLFGSEINDLQLINLDTNSSYQFSNQLIDNTTYYWKVVANDLNEASTENTGGYHSFRVNTANDIPGDFELLSPENTSMVTDLTPNFHWEEPVDPDDRSRSIVSYYVYLDTASSLIGVIPDTVYENSYTPTSDLLEDAMYYWKVEAVDDDGGMNTSVIWSFSVNTSNSPPSAFALLSPAPDSVNTTQVMYFEWESATDSDPMDDVVNYSLDIHVDTVNMHYELNTTSFTSDSLMDNSIYYWSVTAHDMNGGVTENIGGPRMFVINVENDPPTASTLVAPLNESIQTDLTPNFYWTEADDPDPMDHISYTMNWWPMGMLPVIYSADTDSNSFTPEENLTDNSQFGWMVIANDMHDAQSSSDSSYFYTDAFPEPPLNFATVSPENNAEGIATEVEFIWNETDDPDPVEEIHYQLVYATDWEDSSTYVYSDLLEDTSLTLTLTDNSQYYWIVVAMDTDGFMVGSNDNTPNTMVVGTLSIDGADIPEVFALHQNYPNPFNPVTTLRYDLPEDAIVNITIYDMMGRVVKTMVNSQQNAGFKSVRWNATNDAGSPVSAGLYLYMIQAGKFKQTKKMVLLK